MEQTTQPKTGPRRRKPPPVVSKENIDRTPHREAAFILWDDELPGFGLKFAARPRTTKTFVIKYRVGGGRTGTQRQYTIGRYGVLTPDEARKQARKALAAVTDGKDPQGARAEDRKAMTVAALLDLYAAEGMETKKASTVALDKIRIEVIKGLIGKRKANQLTKLDVERMRDAIKDGRLRKSVVAEYDDDAEEAADAKRVKRPGERARGGRTAATKAVKLLKAVYRWAGRLVPVAENPFEDVTTFADVERDRFLSPAELAKLGDALAEAEAEPDPKRRRATHVRIIRLLLLTGARKNEIARLRWSEIRGDHLMLENTKTGRKPKRLGAAAQEVLAGIERGESPWVFPDPKNRDEPVRNLDWAWVGIRKRAGLDDVRIHDLRHSFASFSLADGASLPLLKNLLGHRHIATTMRYAHLAASAEQAAADKVAETIGAAIGVKRSDKAKAGDGSP